MTTNTYFVYETSCYAVEADSEDEARDIFNSPSGRETFLSVTNIEVEEADILPWPEYISHPDEING